MPEITEDHLGAAQSVRVRYSALDLDLAEAVNVALAADYDTDAILTLDRPTSGPYARWVATRRSKYSPTTSRSDPGPSTVKCPHPQGTCVRPRRGAVRGG